MAADDKHLHMLLGELSMASRMTSEALRQQTTALAELSRSVQESHVSFKSLESGLRRANEDIKAVRVNMLTPEHLRSFGLRAEDALSIKLDLEHARESRIAADDVRPMTRQIKTTVAATILAAIFMWAGTTVWQTIQKGNNETNQVVIGARRS